MSSIKLKGSTSGDVTITVPAQAGTNTVTIPAASGNLPLSNLDHVTNRPNTKPIIINGDMQVAQRGTSVTGVTTGAYRTVDRFNIHIDTMGTWTMTQADDAPAGSGFQHSLKLDCTTADASPASGDNITISTRLEGQDVQLFKKGTSSAEKFTVSFWVKATKTGTHILELDDNDNGRNINQAYTINSSNTWEKKVLTFDGDTTGVFGNDNGSSLRLFWWVGAGSNWSSGTLETSWASTTNANRAVGQVNNADSTDNNWYITGVQLEVGEYDATTIPPFQHESFGDNLRRCERYYRQSYSIGTKAGTASTQVGATMVYIPATGNTLRYTLHHYGMRATPTFAEYSPETGTAGIGSYEGSGDTNSEAILTTFANEHSTLLYNTGMGFVGSFYWQYTLSAEI